MKIHILIILSFFLIFSSNLFSQSSGTGFIISKEGYFITCYHVIKGENYIQVTGINNDFNKKYEATLIAKDTINDIALLKIDNPSKKFNIKYCFKWNNSNQGEEIFTLGYPYVDHMGYEIKLSNGIISSVTGYKNDMTTYQISAPIQPGNSGGPLFNKDGFIIGIINAKLNNEIAANVAYAIKSIFVKNLLSSSSIEIEKSDSNYLSKKTLTEQVKLAKKNIILIIANKSKPLNLINSNESIYSIEYPKSGSVINLLNGKQIIPKSIIYDTSSTLLKYEVVVKNKLIQKSIDKIEIFSIDSSNKSQKLFYFQDSLMGNILSVHDMHTYILGEREAIKNYKDPWVTVGGFAAGFLPTTFFFNFYGALAIPLYATSVSVFAPKLKASKLSDSNLIYDYNFVDGYKTAASKKKVKNALFGSVAGFATAVIVMETIYFAGIMAKNGW